MVSKVKEKVSQSPEPLLSGGSRSEKQPPFSVIFKVELFLPQISIQHAATTKDPSKLVAKSPKKQTTADFWGNRSKADKQTRVSEVHHGGEISTPELRKEAYTSKQVTS